MSQTPSRKFQSPAAISISSVSDQILTLVFKHCTGGNQSKALTVSYCVFLDLDKSPAVSLSHVCSRWRKVLLETPSFWTGIRIFLVRPPSSIGILNTFLHRSQRHPLHIVFDCRPRGWHSAVSQQEKLAISRRIGLITDTLLGHISRVRGLLVKADFIEHLNPVISRLKFACAPVLESFRMNVIRTEVVCGQLFLGGAPVLRSVGFGGLHRSWHSLLLHRLSSLDLQFGHRPCIISVSELQGIFAASPHLTSLSLYRVQVVLNPAVEIHSGTHLSILDNLTTLKLGATDTLPSFLSFISASNLHTLYLSDLDDAQLTPAAQALCARSPVRLKFPCLRKLHLSGIVDVLFHPYSLLCAFPTTTHLTLQHLDILNYARLLGDRNPMGQPSSGMKTLLPLLQTLTVDHVYVDGQWALTDVLFTLVMDRIALAMPLKTFRTGYFGMCFDITSPLFSYDVGRFRDIVNLEFHWDTLENEWGDFQSALDDDFLGDLAKSEAGGPAYYYEKEDWRFLEDSKIA